MTLALTAVRDTLVLRAELAARLRAFFAERGVLEVETAALSHAAVSDLHIESLRVASSLSRERYYLQTSPEYAMKRLLAADSGDIYQICRVFRDAELGRWHQPEFTLLEWYRIGWDELKLMQEVEALLATLLAPHGITLGSAHLTYRQAFLEYLGVDPYDSAAVVAALRTQHIDVPSQLAGDALLDLAFSSALMPQLPAAQLTFITDFPASQAALARIKPGTPAVAARFEAFAHGLELANGYAELTDAAEQRRRFEQDLAARRAAGRHLAPLDEDFLGALAGLPDCAGVALGFDRLVALAAGLENIAASMALAHRPAGTAPTLASSDDLEQGLRRALGGETDFACNAHNFVAFLYRELSAVNWVGFYWLRGDELRLGAFQGAPAVTRIALGEGVCGAAALARAHLNIADVHDFAGHIVCDPASRSELVLPVIDQGRLLGVLDIDSPERARFGDADTQRLQQLLTVFLAASDRPSLLDA